MTDTENGSRSMGIESSGNGRIRRSSLLASLACGLWLLPIGAMAETVEPETHHQLAQAASAPKAAKQKPEADDAKPELDHSKMDHSKMDHSKMDHSGHQGHGDHKMVLDDDGMVMNWNDDTPSRDCAKIGDDVAFEVRAGRKYATQGQSFGFSQNEWRVPACSRVTITFVNEDNIRHQWMLHGLPRYLYPQGMFHLEAAGGTTRKGTFIVPSGDITYLVHCDMAQHMEKGLKGQFKVGNGSGDLPSVPGITDARVHDPEGQASGTWQLALLASGMLIGVGAGVGGGWIGRKSKKSK